MALSVTKLKQAVLCVVRAIYDTIAHDGVEHAGYLAFLLMFTIFPFLVFFVAIVGAIGDKQLANTLVSLILESSWATFIDALIPRILEITSSPPQSLLTLAIISAIWTASSLFEGIRTALNKAYRVRVAPGYLLRRLFSFIEFAGMVTIVVLLLLVLVVLPSIWNYLYDLLSLGQKQYIGAVNVVSLMTSVAQTIRYLVLIVFGFIFVAGLYYFLPNRKQKLLYTLPGSLIVLSGWIISSVVFKVYLQLFHSISIIYGSIAGIIIALLYFYICSLIFIFGAELNYQIEELSAK
ncbi:YihY/virulence factor BrkB family protein [Rickettsiales endosymbiont of Peranema trichophorum]|uniref:YihY/virulence factor BrkB family protein n=1 Tax=Rickettsiales endosymbiont of Peranema trichophorum TaxID=2486577 RepID=UPI003979621F